MKNLKFALLATAAATTFSSPALAADSNTPDDWVLVEEYSIFDDMDKDQKLSVGYNFSETESRDRELKTQSLNLGYSNILSDTSKEFYFLSGFTSDYETNTFSSDSGGFSGGYGQNHTIADGLILSVAGHISTNSSDIETLSADSDSQSYGLSVSLDQIIPINNELFVTVGANYSPRYTHVENTNDTDDYYGYSLTPNANIIYRASRDLTLNAGAEYSVSNRALTLRNNKQRVRAGVGATLDIDNEYSLNVKYKREMAANDHEGNLFGLTVARKF